MQKSAFESAYATVSGLVEDFERNKDYFLSPTYSEAAVRKDFIDKFFSALGWDVDHAIDKNPYEQEVKIELNLNVKGRKKRSDYAFYLAPNFRDVAFYAEAKKPSIEIENVDDYFQTIRYGYNSKTPLAILTDFEQFHILDCRYAPSLDTALERGISGGKYHYKEYLDKIKFSEIYYLFSREAVGQGSIAKRALDLPKARGGAIQLGLFKGAYKPIDESLLDELDDYRNTLAHAFKNSNQELDHWALTEIVQRTIDRLIFIRFLEDKLIEPDEIISTFGTSNTSAWKDFISVCRRLDKVYNGSIYKKHSILDDSVFKLNENIFADICEKLSNKNSPYDFNTIPIHILGSIYERFLGKIINTTAKRAVVEDKPEVKKAGGVFYTPEYIVRYIVENTIGKLIEGKSPSEIERMRFIDIACGSGSFLLGAYDHLLRYHANYYNKYPEHRTERDCIEKDGAVLLSLHKKREILLKNIYGVDIDQQAVEVAQMSLYLKLLENETMGSTAMAIKAEQKEKVLPPLGKNIQCGNSIIETDFYEGTQTSLFDSEFKRTVNAFDWKIGFSDIMKNGGFDAVIGNPPYVRQELLTDGKGYFKEAYKVYNSSADLYTYFFERGLNLLNKTGLFGIIVANKWMRANYGQPLRKWLKTKEILQIIDFGSLPVFETAITYPCIFIARPEAKIGKNILVANLKTLDFPDLATHIKGNSIKVNRDFLEDNGWNLASQEEQELLKKVKSAGIPLDEYVQGKIYYGIKTGLNEAFVIDTAQRMKLVTEDKKCSEIIKPFLAGRDIKRYQQPEPDKFLILLRKGITNKETRGKDPWEWLERKYPSIAKHLKPFEAACKARDDQGDYWWELRACDYYNAFENIKIIVPAIVKGASYTADDSGAYSNDKTTIIKIDNLYLLGVLNSKACDFFLKSIASTKQGGYFEYKPMYISKLPIPEPNKSSQEQVSGLVSKMISLNKALSIAKTDHEKAQIQRELAATDQKINTLVYQLYDLTHEEIEVLETRS